MLDSRDESPQEICATKPYHYHIEPVRAEYSTRILLTITRPHSDRTQGDVELFRGEIPEAVSTFDAIGETAKQPREYQILMTVEGSLWRAYEEISALCGERPDPDTEQVYEDIEDACRDLSALRQHLETNDPWRTLAHAARALQRVRESQETPVMGLPTVEVNLSMDAHRRFQRTLPASELDASEKRSLPVFEFAPMPAGVPCCFIQPPQYKGDWVMVEFRQGLRTIQKV